MVGCIGIMISQGAAALASLAMMAGSTNEPAVPLAWLLAFYASRYFYLLRQRQSTIAASLLYQKAAELRLGGFKTSAQVQSEAEEFTRNELESLRVYLRRNRKVCLDYSANRCCFARFHKLFGCDPVSLNVRFIAIAKGCVHAQPEKA